MFESVCTSDENVVDVDKNESETTSNFVHESLKCLCGVAATKRHFGELKQTKWSGDSSFANIVRCDRNLVVCLNKVDFGKYCFAM